MKKGTMELMKFKMLKRRLNLPAWQAIGLLESLWLCTLSNAPAGDIGKFTNEEIAAHIEWDGDHGELIKQLVDTRWLDESSKYRLVVHNWSKHAPTFLKGNNKKYGKVFADLDDQSEPRNEPPSDAPYEPPKEPPYDAPKDAPSYSIPSKPIPFQPPPTPSAQIEPEPDPEPPVRKDSANAEVAAANWILVEESLRDAGLKLVQPAVSAAKTQGLGPPEVSEIVADFHANRSRLDGPQAIMFRLKNGVWPVEGIQSVAEIQAQEFRRSEAKKARDAENAKRLEIAARAAAEEQELEDSFGAVFDGMSPVDRQGLARSTLGDFEFENWGKNPGVWRSRLLEALRGEAEGGEGMAVA